MFVPLSKNFLHVVFFDKCLLWAFRPLTYRGQIPFVAQHLVNDGREGWLWRHVKLLPSLLGEGLYQRTLLDNIRHRKLPHWNSIKELDAIWAYLGLKLVKEWALFLHWLAQHFCLVFVCVCFWSSENQKFYILLKKSLWGRRCEDICLDLSLFFFEYQVLLFCFVFLSYMTVFWEVIQ